MPITYEPIGTTTLGSAAASVEFTSISGSYTDLILIMNGGASTNVNVRLRFNSDSGTNYSSTHLYGDGTTANSERYTSASASQINYYGYPENNFNWNAICHIQNYSNATTYKTIISRTNHAGNGTNASAGLWRSTNAITTILVGNDGVSATFASGSTFTLYGIKAA